MKAKAKVVRTVAKATRSLRAKKKRAVVRAKKLVVKPEQKKQQEIHRLILDHRENGRKLARSLLRRWRVRMPSEEIDSIVDLTLCEAGRRYSDKHGASFMTFLFYHLRGNLVRAVATAAKANNFVVAFARNAGIDVGDWATTAEQPVWSTMPEFSAFDGRESDLPEQLLLRRERIEVCQSACKQLDSLELEVLTRSFANDEPLIDIARTLGYSRCHISRVKKRALDRLRELMSDFHGEPFAVAAEETQVIETEAELPTRLSDQVRVVRKRRSRRRSFTQHAPIAEVANLAVA
jgi:RNA polymerase sigma factor (sigma-70 family)